MYHPNICYSVQQLFLLESIAYQTIVSALTSFFFLYQVYVSPHVRESKTVLDCGFHIVDSGFQVLDSSLFGTWILNWLVGFRIP